MHRDLSTVLVLTPAQREALVGATLDGLDATSLEVTPETYEATVSALVDLVNEASEGSTSEHLDALDTLLGDVQALGESDPREKGDDDGVEYDDPRNVR